MVIGVSAGGLKALKTILPTLPRSLTAPVLVVQHLAEGSGEGLVDILSANCRVAVKQAEPGETPAPGVVYLAPAGYHLLVERDRTLSLSVDPPVHFARPSVDVLFESAAEAYGAGLVGVVLTGANQDGREGVRRIKQFGGRVLVQDPQTAQASEMPAAALTVAGVDRVLALEDIGPALLELCRLAEDDAEGVGHG